MTARPRAETLRQVANEIREDYGAAETDNGEDDPFMFAVADLLESEASLIKGTESHPDLHMPLNGARVDLLTAVARAYLQETP